MFLFHEREHTSYMGSCENIYATWFSCPKQLINALNVHQITKRRAKSQKDGQFQGTFFAVFHTLHQALFANVCLTVSFRTFQGTL